MEAEEVERLVTFQIETGLNGAAKLRRIRSSSMAGYSIVWVEFDWGTDIYRARQVVTEKLPAIQTKLPFDVGEPTLAPVTSIMGEIMLVGVTTKQDKNGEDHLSPLQIRTLTDWEIIPRLKAINGVAQVIAIGGEYKQYQVLAQPDKMKYFDVTLENLVQAIEESNVNAPGGFSSDYGNQYVIKGEGRIKHLSDLEEALVLRKGDFPVKVKDVAQVRIGAADRIGEGSLNLQTAVIISVFKQPQTNTVLLTEDIESALSEMEGSLHGGLEVHKGIFRQADFINTSISNLQRTLLEGAFFVLIILLLFLMNWRTTAISLLAIPISLLVAIGFLYAFGYTINTMSLGGMAIAIGVLVDDAVIDVENVFKRLRQNARLPSGERKHALRIVFDASLEIRSSIINATFIIIVSFIPLFFLSGIEGRLLQPLGIAFIVSLLASLVVAITITPVLCSYLLNREKLLLRHANGTVVESFLQKGYGAMLKRILKVPVLPIGIGILILAFSIYIAFGLGRSFLPAFNEGSLAVSALGLPGMSLEESSKGSGLVDEILLSFPEVETVSRRTGRTEMDEHAQGVHSSEIDAPFRLNGRSKGDFMKEVREKLSLVPGMNITIGQPISHRIDHMLSGTRAAIALKIFGPDLSQLFTYGKIIQREIEKIPGLVDISVEQQIEVPQIRISPKRELLSKYGLTIGDFARFIDVGFAGETVSQVYEGQRSFDLIVRLHPEFRGTITNMKRALIDLPGGKKMPLEQLADFQSLSTPHTINRENVQRKVVVSANIAERDLRSTVNEIKKVLDLELKLPEGYRIEYGGQFESEERASQLLLLASIFAAFIIFLLLISEFKDLKLALIVLLNLPMALIGGVLIIQFTSGIVSIASTIGFISLFGIASRNGILLISRYQALQEEKKPLTWIIIEGSKDRLTPILMTAMTTALALLPLALAYEESGNEIQSPMALVILGGLVSSTILNLLIIPSVYFLMEKSGNSKI
jgi:CzcA family heavy metal efflux pump